jgi:Fe2+ transport system protein FeoA
VPGSTDPAVVSFLDELGVRPGVMVEVREKHPFDGPVVLRVAGSDRTLGERIARQIFVRNVSGNGRPDGDDSPIARKKKRGRTAARLKNGRNAGGEQDMQDQDREGQTR